MTTKVLMEVEEGNMLQLDNVIYVDKWRNSEKRVVIGSVAVNESVNWGGKRGSLELSDVDVVCGKSPKLADVVGVVESRGNIMFNEESSRTFYGAENAEYVDQAREHVEVAAHMLSQMGPDYARLAWVLTDALAFLDEV